MNTGEFFEKVESIYKDWQYDHPRVLYGLIRMLKPSVVVEVGTYLGYGACYMARALQENNSGHLYCIDNWRFQNPEWRKGSVKEHFEQSLSACGVRQHVTLLEGDSDSVPWPVDIDFAYIDGWHSYHVAKHDWIKCVTGGASCICFDDAIGIIGPRMLVDEIQNDPEWNTVRLPSQSGLAICQKKSPISQRRITYSQELEGVEITDADQLKSHLETAALFTKLDYSKYL